MIKIICAHDKNHVIGIHGKMPWHFPEDLQHFKEITASHPIIMGRKTFESIGKPLPGRLNIVLSRNKQFRPEGCTVFATLKEALEFTKKKDVFVIGGQTLFEQALPLADELYLTEINAEFNGDTFFPAFDSSHFKRELLKHTNHPVEADFYLYQRIH